MSLNSSVERVVPFRRSGTIVGHAPATVALLSHYLTLLVSLPFSLSRCTSSFSSLISCPSLLLNWTQDLFYDVERASPVIRDSTRRSLHTSEVLWLSSATSVGFGIPSPALLAPRSISFLRLPEMLSSPIILGRNYLPMPPPPGPFNI